MEADAQRQRVVVYYVMSLHSDAHEGLTVQQENHVWGRHKVYLSMMLRNRDCKNPNHGLDQTMREG